MFKRICHQFLLALAFLTRLPLDWIMPMRVLPLASSTWAFPLAGALVGTVASLPLLLPGPSILNAVLSVGLAVWITGVLHEGALADFADAAEGHDRPGRLAIMSDANIGSFGAVALVLTSMVRVVALSFLGPCNLIAAAAGGRAAIVVMMWALPPACEDGASFAAGKPGTRNTIISSVILAVILIVLVDNWFWPLMAGIVVTGLVFTRARRLLGGYTSDVLGAVAILTETGMLVVMAMTA